MTLEELSLQLQRPGVLSAIKCVLINAVPVLFYAIWGSTFLEELQHEEEDGAQAALSDEERATWLRQIRIVYSFTVLGQILAYGICYEVARMPYHLGWLVFLVGLVAQGQLRFGLEKRLRGFTATESEGFTRMLKAIVAFLGMLVAYAALVHLVAQSFVLAAHALKFSETAAQGCRIVGSFAGVFLAIAAAFIASPVYLRRLLPATKLDDAKLIDELDRCYLDAGCVPPEFYQLELDHFGLHSAVAAGLSGFRGALRPALFLSRALTRDFTSDERRAIILHEISHQKLHHLRKRFLTTLGALTGSCVAAALLIGLAALLVPKEVLPIFALSAAFLPAALPFVLVRGQVLRQEYEADVHAVLELGAKFEGLASALRRIDKLNDQLDQLPGEASKLTASHPATEERIRKLQEKLAAHSGNRPGNGSSGKPDSPTGEGGDMPRAA